MLATPYAELKRHAAALRGRLGVAPTSYPEGAPQRGIYCSRTLNLRNLQAIGYDMDYT